MFERFTDRARRVLVLAQEEARLLGHNFIGTEHLLLGLVRESDGLAAKALRQLGVRLEDVRAKVAEVIGPAGSAPTGSPPFTPRAKKVLELSLREALQLGHNYIGTEHILLGLVREGEGVAAQVLVSLGADLAAVRRQVVQLLGSQAAPPARQQEVRLPRGVPRCSRCDATLSRSARYRTIEVRPADNQPGAVPLKTAVVYCERCGTVFGPYVYTGTRFSSPLAGPMYVGRLQNIRPAPSRQWLDDLIPTALVEKALEDARVDLVYRDNDVIEGKVGGKDVRLSGRVGSHRGPLKGTWGGDALNVNWRIGDNGQANGAVPALLAGQFGNDHLKLKGELRLAPNSLFEQLDLSGDVGGMNFRAEVSAADGGLGSTDAVVAEGTFGEATFELFAALSDDLTKAVVRGSVDGHPISLEAGRDQPQGPVKVYGSYLGPPVFLALIVGTVAYFL